MTTRCCNLNGKQLLPARNDLERCLSQHSSKEPVKLFILRSMIKTHAGDADLFGGTNTAMAVCRGAPKTLILRQVSSAFEERVRRLFTLEPDQKFKNLACLLSYLPGVRLLYGLLHEDAAL